MSRKMNSDTTNQIIEYLKDNTLSSSKEIYDGLKGLIGYATVKRILNKLSSENLVNTEGKGKATRYKLSSSHKLLYPIDLNQYFEKEQDERQIKNNFNFTLITDVLNNVSLFTDDEKQRIEALHKKFTDNISHLSSSAYNKE